jgi:hypothetical protein
VSQKRLSLAADARCSLGRRVSPLYLSTSHAAWDVDAVHGVHATYSVSKPGTPLIAEGRFLDCLELLRS